MMNELLGDDVINPGKLDKGDYKRQNRAAHILLYDCFPFLQYSSSRLPRKTPKNNFAYGWTYSRPGVK